MPIFIVAPIIIANATLNDVHSNLKYGTFDVTVEWPKETAAAVIGNRALIFAGKFLSDNLFRDAVQVVTLVNGQLTIESNRAIHNDFTRRARSRLQHMSSPRESVALVSGGYYQTTAGIVPYSEMFECSVKIKPDPTLNTECIGLLIFQARDSDTPW